MLTDLLSYPYRAGAREETTSRAAAHKIERSGRAEALRQRVLFCLRRPATAKEVAALMGEDINSIRPRLTELKQRNLIEWTGVERNGEHVCIAV
jgi:hypothetical protein